MKKSIIALLAIFGLVFQAQAVEISSVETGVYVAPATVLAGTQQTLSIKLKNAEGAKTLGFVITLPEGLVIAADPEASKGHTNENPMIFSSNKTADNVIKVASVMGEGYAANGDGEIATLLVDVKADAVPGIYKAVVSAIDFQAVGTTTVQRLEDVETEVTIIDHITLDENSTEVPAESAEAKVVVNRTLAADEWSTLCLPFDITVEDLAAALDAEVEVAEFVEYDDTDESGNINVIFDAVDELYANTPYIIKSSKAVEAFEVTTAVTPVEEDAVVEFAEGSGRRKVVYGTFTGVLHAGETVPADNLFLNGGKFYYATELTHPLKAFRGYFWFDADVRDSEVKILVNGETTRINEVQNSIRNNGAIYDLSGKLVNNSNLKGVFIQNGKKFVK